MEKCSQQETYAIAQERFEGFSRPDEMKGYAFIPRTMSLLPTDIMIPISPMNSRFVLFGSVYGPASWRTYLKMPVDGDTPLANEGITPSLFESDLLTVRAFVNRYAEKIKEIAEESGIMGYHIFLDSM